MSAEVLYSADAALAAPRRFIADAAADLRAVPTAAWRLFVRMEQSRYRQSLLRWVWLVAPALIMTLTWVFLAAAGVVNHKHTSVPYAAYVGAGTVVWQTFLDALNSPSTSLTRATQALKCARLPHEAWIIAGALDALVNLAIRLTLLLILLVALGALAGSTLLLVPLALGATALLGLGLGILAAVAGRLYADVGPAISILSGIWFFITPVVYVQPHAGIARHLVEINPMTPMVLSTRAWLTGASGAEPVAFAGVTAAAIVLTIMGWLLYRMAQPHLVERM